jgi:SPP1 gp7 family putative phage head morphogenesis protein
VATLTPWGPADAHAVPLVDMLTRAEREVLGVLRVELRGDGPRGLVVPGALADRLDLGQREAAAVDQLPVDDRIGVAAGHEYHVGEVERPLLPWVAARIDAPIFARDRFDKDGLHVGIGVGHAPHPTTLARLDSLTAALDRVRSALSRYLSDTLIARTVTDTGERAREASERQWAEQVSRELGQRVALDTGPGRERLQAWIAENTARIQGLRNATLEQVRADLETAVLSQVRPEELAAHWERVGLPTRNGTLRGRALVIARDQLGTLASQLAQEQQQALGVEEYDWDATFEVTRKHRAVHRGRHGARYRWDSPPPDGHPGRAVCCGCKPRAVVDRATLRSRFGGR